MLYVVVLYILILFILSAFVIKKALNSYEEYSYCGRSLSIAFVLFTYFGTWIGGGTIVGLVGKSYEFGANQYWIIAMSCIVEVFFAIFFIKKIRVLKLKTIGEFYALKFPDYHQVIRIPVTSGLLIRNVTMVAMQFSALSYLVTFIFDISRNLALLLVFLVITTYTVLSGLWGVVITDVFQGILQTGGLIVLVVFTLKAAGGMGDVVQFYKDNAHIQNLNLFFINLSWWEIGLYIIAFGLFFLMNDQANWERIYASKGEKTAKWGFIIPLIITLILLVFVTYLGVFQRAIFQDGIAPSDIIYHFIFTLIDSKIAAIVLVGLIASIMSSADSFLLASGTMVAEDIIRKFIFKEASDRELIFWVRIFIVVTGSLGFAFAINIEDIIYLWLMGIGLPSILLLPGYFLGWFYKKSTTKGILLGMGVGGVYASLMALGIIPLGALQVTIGMTLNFLVSVFSIMRNTHYTEDLLELKDIKI